MEDEEEKFKILKEIFSFWKRSVGFIDDLIDNIDNGVGNLLKWRKVIWVDKQWDHVYLLQILKFKLTLMEEYFRLHGVSVDGPEDAKKIKRCIVLLERMLEDIYFDEAYAEYNKKWKDDVDDFLKGLINRKPMSPEQTKDSMAAAQTEEDLINKDYDELFGIMRKEIRGWWD